MKTNRIVLAAAAAALFVAGHVASAAEDADKVKCEAANACKGQSACGTAKSSCKGQNACKGQGFLMLSEDECKEAKAKLEAEAKSEKEG